MTTGAKLIFRNYPFPTIGNRCGAVGTVQVEGQAIEGGVYKHALSFWNHAGTQITSPQAGMRIWVKTGIPKALNPLTDFSSGAQSVNLTDANFVNDSGIILSGFYFV